MTELLDTIRQELLLPLMAAYRAAGGDAVASPYGPLGEPNQMLVSVVMPAQRGDNHTYAIDSDEWRRAVRAVARHRRPLTCTVEICDPMGFAVGRTEITLDPRETAPALAVPMAQPHLALLCDLAPVTTVQHAVERADLSVGGASTGRPSDGRTGSPPGRST